MTTPFTPIELIEAKEKREAERRDLLSIIGWISFGTLAFMAGVVSYFWYVLCCG